jgi:hypothetical protein
MFVIEQQKPYLADLTANRIPSPNSEGAAVPPARNQGRA